MGEGVVDSADCIIAEGGDVDEADSEVGEIRLGDLEAVKCFFRDEVADADEDEVGIFVAGELADAGAAVLKLPLGVVRVNPAGFVGLAEGEEVDDVGLITGVSEAASGCDIVEREVAVGGLARAEEEVGDEAGVLVGVAVVVLAPADAGREEVEGFDGFTPTEVAGLDEELLVLVDLAGDDGEEGFVAGDPALAAGEVIAHGEGHEGVFAEEVDGAAIGTEVFVPGFDGELPGAVGGGEDSVEFVAGSFVGAEEADM